MIYALNPDAGSRIGMITFASDATIQFGLGQYNSLYVSYQWHINMIHIVLL